MSFWSAWATILIGLAVAAFVVTSLLKIAKATYNWVERKYGYDRADKFATVVFILFMILPFTALLAGAISANYHEQHRAPVERVQQ